MSGRAEHAEYYCYRYIVRPDYGHGFKRRHDSGGNRNRERIRHRGIIYDVRQLDSIGRCIGHVYRIQIKFIHRKLYRLRQFNGSSITYSYRRELTIAQDSSYNLTANATLTNSACYTSLSFSGHTVGGIFYLTNTASSGVAANSVVVVGIQSNPTTPNVFQAGYQLLAGCDAGDQGTGTLTKQ